MDGSRLGGTGEGLAGRWAEGPRGGGVNIRGPGCSDADGLGSRRPVVPVQKFLA